MCKQIAGRAAAQGVPVASLKRLADAAKEAAGLETRLAASSCAANAERDLHRSVAAEGWVKLHPSYVEIPVRGKRRKETVLVNWPVLLPHCVFAELARWQLLNSILGADRAGDWWRSARQEGAKVAQHPMVKDRETVANVIPIRTYGVCGLAVLLERASTYVSVAGAPDGQKHVAN